MSKYPQFRVEFYPAETSGGVKIGRHYAVERKIDGGWLRLRHFETAREANTYRRRKEAAAYEAAYGAPS